MDKARAKAKEIGAAIQDACDIAHGAATAWCPDEAEDLIAAALAALDGGEAVPGAAGINDVAKLMELGKAHPPSRDGEDHTDAWQRSVNERLSAWTPPRSEVERALDAIIAANAEFRKGMPDDWQGDPLQDAIERAAAIRSTP